MAKVFLFIFSLLIMGCSDSSSQTHVFIAEEIIHFEKPSFACLSADLYDTALLHSVRGEKTKFAGMFSSSDCFEIPLNVDFKILNVNTGSSSYGIEITNVKNTKNERGMFTSSDFAVLSRVTSEIAK